VFVEVPVGADDAGSGGAPATGQRRAAGDKAVAAGAAPPSGARASSAPHGPDRVAGTRVNRGDPVSTAPGSESLARWRGALAKRETRPADVVVVGDSITEGLGVPDDARWISQLRRDLQRSNPAGAPGGEGYIPAWHVGRPPSNDPGWVQRWSLQGFPAWTDSGFGLGRRAVVIDNMNETASITVTGDRLWVSFTAGPDQGLMRVLVDGTIPAIVDTYAPVTQSGRVWDSGPLARGNHSVEVADVLGSRVVLDGITAFDGDGGSPSDHGRGIRMWDGGHSGATAGFYAAGAAHWADGLDVIRPDLVIIELGANDQSFAVGADRFRANLSQMVDTIRASATAGGAVAPSVALMPVFAASNRSAAEWERYRAAMFAVATAKGCAVLDVWTSLHQVPAVPTTDGLFMDTIHPNLAGSRWLGDLVAHLLVP
jgi:lysophospholipase L1-like esterase